MHRVHASYLSFLYSLHKNCTSFLRPASDMLFIVMRFKYIFGNVFFLVEFYYYCTHSLMQTAQM